ncbi:hypothetical protein [Mycobacteroides abscessus]|uniref:hypothetical protein n=1 Tax=Mycobacteroides abscessus TaxID=36809 RepID=UPI00089DD032|nr:hypothetical protein [Mycobacteroides abscessus]RIR93170.1 hypothetical protein D2E50_07890 [Mycobacteroides abscessus]RIU25618.1 hypothetical protein D2E86_12710 [Mycobacteroides abscessus]
MATTKKTRRKPKNLVKIAHKHVDWVIANPDAALFKREIAEMYKLDDQQTDIVKDYVQQLLSQDGLTYAYDYDKRDGFKLVPMNDCFERRRMLANNARHSAATARALRYQIDSALLVGQISEFDAERAKSSIINAAGQIELFPHEITWHPTRV